MKRYLLSLLIGLWPLVTLALAPVEGILLGEAQKEIQNDPLALVFSDMKLDPSQNHEHQKLKWYQTVLSGGVYFDSCTNTGPISYSTKWREIQAKRSVVSALQYIGLDRTIKAIGAYGKLLQLGEAEYGNLVSNIVTNYCSENVTVMSLKTIRKSLAYYYQNPEPGIIPDINMSAYATDAFKSNSSSSETRSQELQFALRNFRAFCSWGGNVDDFRLLPPYLKNPFIMNMVSINMAGIGKVWDEKAKDFASVKDAPGVVRVVCKDLICRQTTKEDFIKDFPLSTGSTGVLTDLTKLYCQDFRFADYDAKKTIPEVKTWIKAQELEDPIFETNFFLSLMTGVPDPFMGARKYSDIPFVVKSSVDERWTKWSRDVLGTFSRDLMFEESLRVKAHPRRNLADLGLDGFRLDFHVTLGEMDRIMKDNDKIGMSFDFKLSKNWLHSLITRYNAIAEKLDVEGEKAFRADVARYIDLQLKTKEKLFTQKLWNDDFSRLIAEELLGQVLTYKGSYFKSYQDEMVTVPVKFSYGIFALSYVRYRAQVARGATKLNL